MTDQPAGPDHDQRLKVLIREFLREFFALFFPLWFERFDFTGVEWLDKEVFLNPPQGEHRVADLVARIPTHQELPSQRAGERDSFLALIHIEVESDDRTTRLKPRMSVFYNQLRQRHQLSVLPIAVYLRVGRDGVGWDVYEEFFWEQRILHFEYAYIGLPALDAETYVRGDNLLGVALSALMRVPEERRAWLRAEAERRILKSSETPAHRFLLHECVAAYLRLSPEQQREYQDLLGNEPFGEIKEMIKTENEIEVERRVEERLKTEQERLKTEQERFEEGLKERLKTEQERLKHQVDEQLKHQVDEQLKARLKQEQERNDRETLRFALETRFGQLTPEVLQRLGTLPVDRLRELLIQVIKGQSLAEMGLEQ